MVNHEYKRTLKDHCVYVTNFMDGFFIAPLWYVNDMLIIGKDVGKLDWQIKERLEQIFWCEGFGTYETNYRHLT